MNFAPKTKDALQRESLLPDNIYDFTVVKAEDTTSKTSGNPMIALNLRCQGPDDADGFVNDYLMESMLAKMYEFCEATGLLDKYHAGTLEAEDCVDKCGKLRLVIQEDKKGDFGPRNSVRKYISPTAIKAPIPATLVPDPEEESPFLK